MKTQNRLDLTCCLSMHSSIQKGDKLLLYYTWTTHILHKLIQSIKLTWV